MKRRIKSIIGNTLGATDGEIGKVKSFLFDSETWTIRYLVVETGSWLFGRKVLISPQAVILSNWEHDIFQVNLTKDIIFNSPLIDTEKPILRHEEQRLHQHYPWITYWNQSDLSGIPISYPNSLPFTEIYGDNRIDENSSINPHLRGSDLVNGFLIHATDGEIGKVEDLILNDVTWTIDFIEVDTGNWFPGKKVVLSPKLIKEIQWDVSTILVNASVAIVKNSPEYYPGKQMDDSYENGLLNHYVHLHG